VLYASNPAAPAAPTLDGHAMIMEQIELIMKEKKLLILYFQ